MNETINTNQIANAAQTVKLIAEGWLTVDSGHAVWAQIADSLTEPGAVEYVANIVDLMRMKFAPDPAKFYSPDTVEWFGKVENKARDNLRDNG
jgi:hypothetical protein